MSDSEIPGGASSVTSRMRKLQNYEKSGTSYKTQLTLCRREDETATGYAKRILESALESAANRLVSILEDSEATPAEILAASKLVIELTQGKGTTALKVQGEDDDIARRVMDAIAGARNPDLSGRNQD